MNSKLHLKTTKTKVVPNGQSENCFKIEGVCYLTLETGLKFAIDKVFVVNTKAKNLLTSSCAIALNLLSLNKETSKSNQNWQHQSKTSETSSKCENNLTTHDIKYKNSESNLDLADVNKKITSAYWQGLFAGKIKKLKDREIKLHIINQYCQLPRTRDVSHFLWKNQFVRK